MTRIHPWKFPKQNGWSPDILVWCERSPCSEQEVGLETPGDSSPKDHSTPDSHPFSYRSKCLFNKWLVCWFLRWFQNCFPCVPRDFRLCWSRPWLVIFTPELLLLGWWNSKDLVCAADLYLRLWPGDSAANSQWHCPSDLGLLGQLQVLPPHFSLKCINLTGLPVIQHSDILWAFLLDGCSPCQFNGKLLELQQILSLNKESSFLWLGSDMVNAERWSNISSAFL